MPVNGAPGDLGDERKEAERERERNVGGCKKKGKVVRVSKRGVFTLMRIHVGMHLSVSAAWLWVNVKTLSLPKNVAFRSCHRQKKGR